ncbi:zinc finger protein 91-like [Bufo gargarizans]|uniref:zinc finger protein 91-like n=1 Tax=Bufo gargarizans TaxID=30331 RepID=UPI001CF2BFC2|nr:zinc finger protein 91-like [Bufo gargarizans]
MDPEVWKMAATSFKMMNPQKGIFAPKMLQVKRDQFISTERLKKPTNLVFNEDYITVEDKAIHANGKTSCAKVFKSVEHGEIKTCVRQREMVYKPSVVRTDLMSKSLALKTSGVESQNVRKLPYEVHHKRLPILVRDRGHTFIPQRQEKSSTLLRQDGRIKCSEVKNLVSNHCAKTKSIKTNVLKEEPMFQSIGDAQCRDADLQNGVPFNDSKKTFLVKNIPYRSDTSDPCKRIKISNVTSVCNVGRICQKVVDELPRRQMPTISGAQTYSDVSCKTATNGILKDKCKSPPPDEIKGGITNKEKNKFEGSSTRKRFLLIDSQGVPYTVVVEEPTDSTPTEVSKSLAPRKVYKCPVCFRIFEYLSYLQRHSIAHSQQKPHVCKVCGKAFKRTSHLTRHKYTHFGGKPCHCQICQRRFRDIGELTRHLQSHTGEKKSLI